MSGSGFALLLGFALLKIALGLTLIYLGLRGGGRDDPDEPFAADEPPVPPRLPPRRARAARRGGPRAPARAPRRVRA